MSLVRKINIDAVNLEDLKYSLTSMGGFELIGSKISALSNITTLSIKLSKTLLNIPIEELSKFSMKDYNGFHNIKKISEEHYLNGGDGEIKNQIAFHFKSGQKPNSPENIGTEIFYQYMERGLEILNILYGIIKVNFIKGNKQSHIDVDTQSVLTIRRYFESERTKPKTRMVGISSHSDYGLLTLIVSDTNGLEIKADKWVRCSALPTYRYYVIVGDWLKFQLGRGFKSALHRVPCMKQERHSLSLFLNPPYGETVYSTYEEDDDKKIIQEKLSIKLKTSLLFTKEEVVK